MRYSLITAGEARRNHRQTMTHTLCLDNCQTFEFFPHAQGVTVTRRATHPATMRLAWTGQFQMTREEGRKLWTSLIKDGAFRA
jgi:hypothetical protein